MKRIILAALVGVMVSGCTNYGTYTGSTSYGGGCLTSDSHLTYSLLGRTTEVLTPQSVQTFAGHSSLTVMMDRYGHLFPSDVHKAAMDAIAGELMG
jgi:hypothetical protein